MQIVSFLFDDSPELYKRMAKVLAASVNEHCGEGMFTLIRVHDRDKDIWDKGRGRITNYTQNTRKTRWQRKVVEAAPDGELICFLDADMLVLQPLNEIEQFNFDLALTYAVTGNVYKFNTGTTFVRISDKMRDFYRDWEARAIKFLCTPQAHAKYSKEYGGINQSSLASLLDERKDIQIFELQTHRWNALNTTHSTAMEQANVVHIIGDLRRSLGYKRMREDHPLKALHERWYRHERQIDDSTRT